MSRRKTYGFTREKAERISKNTEEAYLRLYEKFSISKEQLKDLGEQSLKSYVETNPDDFHKEDFLDITNCTDNECSCVFSQEEIERLVELTKEPSYTLPRGLSREERRKWISDIGSKLLTQNSEKGKLVNE